MGTENKTGQPKPDPNRIGIIGSGTMGSGIALAALLAGLHVILYDVSPEMLARAGSYIETHLNKKNKAINFKNLTTTGTLEELGGASVVIEAASEDLSLKTDLFRQLDAICTPGTILATNTSTLPVTAIAAASARPERVAGMHFFNPAAVLPLVEVIRGAQTSEETLQTLIHLAKKMGKQPVVALDTPGFIVNRVARPFYGEALRLLGEGACGAGEIDQVVRQGGGFRMGPFELMDLIGIDVNFAATQSIYEQSFNESRYRPHPIQARMVQQNTLGKKSGQGFYNYTHGSPSQTEDFEPASSPLGDRTGILMSRGSWAPGMWDICTAAGYEVVSEVSPGSDQTALLKLQAGIVRSSRLEQPDEQARRIDLELPPGVPLLVQCADVTAAEASQWVANPARVVGFDGLFFSNGPVVTLTPGPLLDPTVREAADAFIRSLGRQPVWMEDTPALILPRIVCMLVNEASFAVMEGVAEPDTIDQAMQLGTSYPKGPLAWGREISAARVVAVLDHLQNEYKEERYRAAPLLRQQARLEKLLRGTSGLYKK